MSHLDGSAGEMVSPAKTAVQVNAESLEGKELYKVSHNDFDVGMLRDVCSSLHTELKLVRSRWQLLLNKFEYSCHSFAG